METQEGPSMQRERLKQSHRTLLGLSQGAMPACPELWLPQNPLGTLPTPWVEGDLVRDVSVCYGWSEPPGHIGL